MKGTFYMVTIDKLKKYYSNNKCMKVVVLNHQYYGTIGELNEIRKPYNGEFIYGIWLDDSCCRRIYLYDLEKVFDVTDFIEECEYKNINVKNPDGSYKNLFDIGDKMIWRNIEMENICENNLWNIFAHGLICSSDFNPNLITITRPKAEVHIKDVNIIVPNKVVEVTFEDDTKEKAVCNENDTFSLEQAIAICIGKKIMGGSGAYNNAVRRGVKVYENKLNKEIANMEEKERTRSGEKVAD